MFDLQKTIKIEIIEVELIKLKAKQENIEANVGLKKFQAGEALEVHGCYLAISLELEVSNIERQVVALEKERNRLWKETRVWKILGDK